MNYTSQESTLNNYNAVKNSNLINQENRHYNEKLKSVDEEKQLNTDVEVAGGNVKILFLPCFQHLLKLNLLSINKIIRIQVDQ